MPTSAQTATAAAPSPADLVIDAPPVPTLQGSRWHSTIKWGTNIALLGGGAAMAAVPEFSLSPWAYAPFLVGHIVWSVFAWLIKEKELFWLNLGATALDIWAILARVL